MWRCAADVNTQGIAYVRGDRIPITDLGARLGEVYKLRPDEQGVSPNALYDKTIARVLAAQNITFDQALDDEYVFKAAPCLNHAPPQPAFASSSLILLEL